MIRELEKTIGIQKSIETEYKKFKEFPKTLFGIGGVAFIILGINSLVNFIQFNYILNSALYSLALVVILLAFILNIKINLDFKKLKEKFMDEFKIQYEKVYNDAITNRKIEDVDFSYMDNKLQRKLDVRCINQEITKEMIDDFLNFSLDSRQEKTLNPKTYPLENWGFYQIHGLEKAVIVNNYATLIMKNKLPKPEDITVDNLDIVEEYIKAILTLTRQEDDSDKKKVKKQEEEIKEFDRTMIDDKMNEEVMKNNVKNAIENDSRFEGMSVDEIIDTLTKIKNGQ